MRNWLVIVSLVLVANSFGQNGEPKELGIGFAIATNPNHYEDLSIPSNLFKNKELTVKWTSKNVFPYFYKPDYGLYHFICIEVTHEYLKILVNDNEIAYLTNNSSFYFKSWDALLLNTTVERLTKDNPIHEEATNHSGIITHTCELDRLIIEDIIQINNEYWIQIYFSNDCEDYSTKNTNTKYGWIKWRTKNKLLVDILLLC